MYGWKRVYVIGSDLAGRRCRVACVSVPSEAGHDRALRYVQQISHERMPGDPSTRYLPYATVTEIEEA